MQQEGKDVPPLGVLNAVFRIETDHFSPKALIHDQSATHLPHKTMKFCSASVALPPRRGFQVKHPQGICILFSRKRLL